jgi:hypothetical protein
MLAEAQATDAAEDRTFGHGRGDEAPTTLRGRVDRRRRFAQAKQVLDAEQAMEHKLNGRAVIHRVELGKCRIVSKLPDQWALDPLSGTRSPVAICLSSAGDGALPIAPVSSATATLSVPHR